MSAGGVFYGQSLIDNWDFGYRRMYDSITLGLPQLPPGVSMAEVVQDSEERELIAAAAADHVTPAQVGQNLLHRVQVLLAERSARN